MRETLLEKAKKIQIPVRVHPISEEITLEHFELIKAFINGEVTVRQAAGALDFKNPGNFTHWAGRSLMRLFAQGKLRFHNVSEHPELLNPQKKDLLKGN